MGNIVSRSYFRMLPIQLFMLIITAINGLVSGLFAGNFIGGSALAVLGLYSPFVFLVTAVSAVFLGVRAALKDDMLNFDQNLPRQPQNTLAACVTMLNHSFFTGRTIF